MSTPISAWTRFPVGLEEGPDGATHVHSLSIAGCVSSGPSREAALDAFGGALADWLRFLESQGQPIPPLERELEIAVDEWITTDADVGGGASNVCFEADRAPLARAELLNGMYLLGALRGRILPHIRRKRDEELALRGDPRWNARLILDELARAQWWTLTRLGASPLAEVPQGVVARLDTAMALAVQQLSELPEDRRDAVIELDGEEWTARKVLRRLLWLEWSLGAAALHALAMENDGGTTG